MDPSTTKEGGIYHDLCGQFPITSSSGNKYIYVMYVYGCNVILTVAMKNRSDKEMKQALTELTTDLKIHGINPGFHFMDNEASTALKREIKNMDTKYHLVPPSNNRTRNLEIAI